MFDGLFNEDWECDWASSGMPSDVGARSVQKSLCAGDSSVVSTLGPRMLDVLPEDVIIRILQATDTASMLTCQSVRPPFKSHYIGPR